MTFSIDTRLDNFEVVGLPVRYSNVLANDGIITVKDLVKAVGTKGGAGLERTPNIGKKGAKMILDVYDRAAPMRGAPEKSCWQPIETAPNYHAGERLRVLVWNRYLGNGGVEMCLADGDFWRHRGEDCAYTHWMPLPASPKA
ncbi:hypothetical protein [Cypionkella sp. TWP1-2-1b2]|uniref:hypothetical protein n=1 Tax=Cypionkella sp. TWP1-2-1b2 TaxID=2804675 RepID=UPI003CEC5F04